MIEERMLKVRNSKTQLLFNLEEIVYYYSKASKKEETRIEKQLQRLSKIVFIPIKNKHKGTQKFLIKKLYQKMLILIQTKYSLIH